MFINRINFIRSLWPKSDCLLCLGTVDHNCSAAQLICQQCLDRLTILKQACPVCALPLVGKQTLSCGECLKQTPPFKKTIAAFHYEPPVSDFISQLKFRGRRQLLPLLIHYLTNALEQGYLNDSLPQELVPVPLYVKKLRQRGFNQAQLIAKRLSNRFSIKLNDKSVSRIRQTAPQVDLDAVSRSRNLRGAFATNATLADHVAIVDDVMTTGTTVSELAHQLVKSGCKRVDVWCLARAYSI